MSEELKIYPSGFLGSSLVPQTAPVDVTITAKQLFNKGLNPKISRYTANQEVVSLWDDANSGTPAYHTFDFKMAVVSAALRAFGTTLLIDWIGMQAASPYYSRNHRDWIDETLAFVYDGRRRRLSENNWYNLLTADQDPIPSEKFSRVVKHYLLGEKLRSEPLAHSYRGHITVTDFIADWCACEGGSKDLLGQLNNLFGKR